MGWAPRGLATSTRNHCGWTPGAGAKTESSRLIYGVTPTLVGLLDCRPGLFPDADTFPPLWASQHTIPSARLGSSPEIECPAPRGPKGHTWYRKHCSGWGARQQRCTDTRCPCASSRHRGLIHAYEFAVDRLAFQSALPICRASGDSVPGYNYDLALAFP